MDAAILNFALNLEYLEAAYYLAAVGRLTELPGYSPEKVILPEGLRRHRIPAPHSTPPKNSPPPPVTKVTKLVGEFANEIAEDELSHVVFLRTVLDSIGAPVAELPVLNLSTSFTAAATAADSLADGGLGFDPNSFNPFANDTFFLHGAFIFEDVGVTAYKGAARYITNKDYLEAAAGISR